MCVHPLQDDHDIRGNDPGASAPSAPPTLLNTSYSSPRHARKSKYHHPLQFRDSLQLYVLFASPHQAVKCLQQALQPLASEISLQWDLPLGLEATVIRKAPEMIFPGHQSIIYAQIHGKSQVK